jgi:hypothetical protein
MTTNQPEPSCRPGVAPSTNATGRPSLDAAWVKDELVRVKPRRLLFGRSVPTPITESVHK